MKAWYESKTVWFQVLTGIATAASAVNPLVGAFFEAHPQTIIAIIAGVNALLRMATNDGIGLTGTLPDNPPPPMTPKAA